MASLHCHTAFFSDIHLGTTDCKAAYLPDVLRQLRCERLYLVGDIVDLEALTKRPWWHASHTAVIDEIFRMARRGVDVIYIPGNHDAPMRRQHGHTFAGIGVAVSAVHRAADGRRYRVSHGDEFDPEHTGRRRLVQLGESLHRLICCGNRSRYAVRRRLPYCRCRSGSRRVSVWPAYIRAYPPRVAADTRRQGFDGHSCDPTHFGHVHEHGGVRCLNDGDGVEHRTALREDHAGRTALIHGSEVPTVLAQLGATPRRPVAAGAMPGAHGSGAGHRAA